MRPTLTVAIVLALLLAPRPGQAAGPWRAKVVDASSGAPLPGVLVLAEFIKKTAGPVGGSAARYWESEEVVTGPDGRFDIASRMLWNPIRWLTRIDLEFRIFKPGYGQARPRLTPRQAAEWHDLSWADLLEKSDVVIELPPLPTREARREFYMSSRFPLPSATPLDRQKRFREAMNQERVYVGLGR